MRLMVVEDDDSIREAVCEAATLEGYHVESAHNGRVALDRLVAAQTLPDLILLDLNMPVMSGTELIERLQGGPDRLRKVPVLLMSAVPDAGSVAGVAGLLRKPVDLDVLLEKLASFANSR